MGARIQTLSHKIESPNAVRRVIIPGQHDQREWQVWSRDIGRLGGFLGASWGVLGGKTVLEPSWSRLGTVLEASWKRLGDVLGRLGSVLGASYGRLGDFLGRLVGLLGRLGASWSHLVLDSILDTIL